MSTRCVLARHRRAHQSSELIPVKTSWTSLSFIENASSLAVAHLLSAQLVSCLTRCGCLTTLKPIVVSGKTHVKIARRILGFHSNTPLLVRISFPRYRALRHSENLTNPTRGLPQRHLSTDCFSRCHLPPANTKTSLEMMAGRRSTKHHRVHWARARGRNGLWGTPYEKLEFCRDCAFEHHKTFPAGSDWSYSIGCEGSSELYVSLVEPFSRAI